MTCARYVNHSTIYLDKGQTQGKLEQIFTGEFYSFIYGMLKFFIISLPQPFDSEMRPLLLKQHNSRSVGLIIIYPICFLLSFDSNQIPWTACTKHKILLLTLYLSPCLALPLHHYFVLHLSAAFAMIDSTKLSGECQTYGIPMLCYNAFPLCDMTSKTPRPRQICKDECEILAGSTCGPEYLMAQTLDKIGQCKIVLFCEKGRKCIACVMKPAYS